MRFLGAMTTICGGCESSSSSQWGKTNKSSKLIQFFCVEKQTREFQAVLIDDAHRIEILN